MAGVKVKELFNDVKKFIAAYQSEVAKLDQREEKLKGELEALQLEMNENVMSQENANVSDLIYLKVQAKEIVQKSEVIAVLLEELAEERTALKLKYVPLYRQALAKSPTGEYNANEIVERHKYEMLTEIASIGKQMRLQYLEIAPDVEEVFQDERVLEQFPRLKYQFNYDSYKPSFNWLEKSVVAKNEVVSASQGNLPSGLKQPKEKDVK
ncbi:hypothetical protein A3863_14445 [Priestia endophytica]|uniref:hypothetical protein n=1 Tax=Priestia endophytica TaxID=135735 RepID=UPI000DCA8704|nr:hypothetical protein [Priestia endophytica]RAS88191.1 hypothetical protein A3863_14445 [Priestia endophytica]